jgi:hypothetical protein
MRKEIEKLGHYPFRSPDKIRSLLRLVFATRLSSAKGFCRKEFASSLPLLMTSTNSTSLSSAWEEYHANSVH